MSLITISSLERITASKLAEMLLAAGASNGESIAVVDVRDDGEFGLVFSSLLFSFYVYCVLTPLALIAAPSGCVFAPWTTRLSLILGLCDA